MGPPHKCVIDIPKQSIHSLLFSRTMIQEKKKKKTDFELEMERILTLQLMETLT